MSNRLYAHVIRDLDNRCEECWDGLNRALSLCGQSPPISLTFDVPREWLRKHGKCKHGGAPSWAPSIVREIKESGKVTAKPCDSLKFTVTLSLEAYQVAMKRFWDSRHIETDLSAWFEKNLKRWKERKGKR